MVRAEDLNSKPIVTIPYEYLETGGARRYGELPVLMGMARGLPDTLDALVLTSDLQGIEPSGLACGQPRLLGTVVATWLHAMASSKVIPAPERTGVVLAGDFHVDTSLGKRGGSGDVRPVWEAFGSCMKWVAGVPGNHDRFEASESGGVEFSSGSKCDFLDGRTVDVDSVRIAGLGGVIGASKRPYRRPETDFLKALKQLCSAGPDVLVLHQSPDGRRDGCEGSVPIRDCLESLMPMFVVVGHTVWPEPIVNLKNGTQVLNVAGRVVVLRRRD